MITMTKYTFPCDVDGCNRKTHGRSPLCSFHMHRLHAHGHALQEPIRTALKEPLHRILQWEKSPEGKAAVNAATSHYVKLGQFKLTEYLSDMEVMQTTGTKNTSYHHEATEIIAQTYQSKDHRQTVRELLAMGIMLEETPENFRSDLAALCEAGQTFMRGSMARHQAKFRPKVGRRVAVTRYVKRGTRAELGKYLMKNFVFLGVVMAREWTRKIKADQREKEALVAAMQGKTTA